MAGYNRVTVPPSDDPAALMPGDNNLGFLSQCERVVGIGPKITPHDIPMRKPWKTNSGQDSSHSAVAAVATTRVILEQDLSIDTRTA